MKIGRDMALVLLAAAAPVAAGAQDAHVAALQAQRGGVAGHVGTALVDDGHHAHGHGGLFNDKPVRAHLAGKDFSDGIGRDCHLPHALCHCRNPRLGQCQTIEHDGGDVRLCRLHVLRVCRENVFGMYAERLRHCQKSVIFRFSRCGCQKGRGCLCLLHLL